MTEIEAKELIAINQIGYRPQDIKELKTRSKAGSFVIKDSIGSIVYEGKFSEPVSDPASGDEVYRGEFSRLTKEGEYTIEIPELNASASLVIGNNVYKELHNATLEFFYYQRSGEELPESRAGKWAHRKCYDTKAKIYNSEEKLDVTGGWHDAGDYGRYVSPGVKAATDLLLSGNDSEDLLNEVKYELNWLLKMQDQETGGVYHKVTTANFIGMVMPDTNTEELILSPISATATGAFSALMALVERKYRNRNPEFSQRALEASLKAWEWLVNNPEVPGFKNPEGIVTGEYDDEIDGDERFWAAIELFLTTGDEKFHQYAIESYKGNKWEGFGWADVGTYGVTSYIFSDSPLKNSDFNTLLENDFKNIVKELSNKTVDDGYGVSLGTEYNWGSNMTVADNGVILLLGWRLTGNRLYWNQALSHLNYILGSNPLGQSYLTGFGSTPIKNPHHRPSEAVGEAVPGMLSGGPNSNLQDPLAQSKLAGLPPSKCFIDAEPSYSTNEVTIYWNSPLYRLLTPFVD